MKVGPDAEKIKTIDDGFATPTIINEDARTFCGALYDDRNRLVMESQRTKFGGNEWNPADAYEIERPNKFVQFEGSSLYLGHYTGHYGHFLLETLSRFWVFAEDDEFYKRFDHFVFHPFLHKTPDPEKFSPAKICFDCFGIDPGKFVLLTGPAGFDRITVPPPFFEINYFVNERMGVVYKKIQEFAVCLRSSGVGWIDRVRGWSADGDLKLYLSRRKARGYHPMNNEREVERVFAEAGFKILHPERWSFEQQLALFSRAEVIAGAEGSALHNSLFMKKGSKVLSIGTPREPSGFNLNQSLCNSLNNVSIAYIDFKGGVGVKNRANYDVGYIKKNLSKIL